MLSATGRLSDGEREILIMDVGKGGPGEKAGLLVGDRIVSAGGRRSKPFSKSTEAGVEGAVNSEGPVSPCQGCPTPLAAGDRRR